MNESELVRAMEEKLKAWYDGAIARGEIESYIRYGNLTEEEKKRLGLITFPPAAATPARTPEESAAIELLKQHRAAVYGFPDYDDCLCLDCQTACRVMNWDPWSCDRSKLRDM